MNENKVVAELIVSKFFEALNNGVDSKITDDPRSADLLAELYDCIPGSEKTLLPQLLCIFAEGMAAGMEFIEEV